MANFWENIARYPKFFFSSLAGLVIIITSPIRKLSKNSSVLFILFSTLILLLTLQIFISMLEIEF